MLRIVAAFAALAVGATLVHAQSAAIGQRQAAFKEMGKGMKQAGGMLKGETPFDLAAVQAILKTVGDKSTELKGLFPDDSKTGGDTAALPVVWEKKDDFLPRFDKLTADTKTVAAAIKDEASFKEQWKNIGANCGTCHKVYRKPD